MKKILIVYSKEGQISDYAQALKKGAEKSGHQVTLKEAVVNRHDIISCHSYDLLVVASPLNGIIKVKIAEDIRSFLSQLKRTGGQEAIAFTKRKLIGTDKGLRSLMATMEKEGCIVKDFRAFKSKEEAFQYGEQIKNRI